MSQCAERLFSSSELDRAAKVLPVERRRMIKQGVLKPRRTAAGWALFTQEDIRRAAEWKLARQSRGGKRRAR